MLDDIHLKGENSSVIKNLTKSDITGVATGAFRDAVEVMYVESILQNAESMEIQVCQLYLHYYILNAA